VKLRLTLLLGFMMLFASAALACEQCKKDRLLGEYCYSGGSGYQWCYGGFGEPCVISGDACCTTCRSAFTSGDETAGPVAEGVLKSAVANGDEELPLGGFTLQHVESAVVREAATAAPTS
jgi:hypothetical protein